MKNNKVKAVKEDPNQDKRSRKLLKVYKLLPKIYQKFSYMAKSLNKLKQKKE